MWKYLFFLAFFLFCFDGHTQERSVPVGFELVTLDGNDAYLNLETGEIKLINVNSNSTVPVENKISNSIAESSALNNIHIVKKGETLYKIAKKYGIAINDIYRLNNKSDATIYIGQGIIVNSKNNSNSTVNNVYDHVHTVKKGETLYRLSKNYNISIGRIKELNQLSSNNIIVGQRLRLK